MLPTSALVPLILFVAALPALSQQALTAGSHSPREHRAAALVSLIGAACALLLTWLGTPP